MAKNIMDTRLYGQLIKLKRIADAPVGGEDGIADKYRSNIKILVTKKTEAMLAHISETFGTYTDHSVDHSIRVCEHIFDLIEDDIDKFSATEIALMIMAALFHDIGMNAEGEEDSIQDDIARADGLSYKNVLKYIAKNDKEEALRFIVREQHGKRALEKLKRIKEIAGANLFNLGDSDISLIDVIAKLAQSHSENLHWVKDEKNGLFHPPKGIRSDFGDKSQSVNLVFIAVLLRLADYMDINSDRAAYFQFAYQKQYKEQGKEHWAANLAVANNDKVELDSFCEMCEECSKRRKRIVLKVNMERAMAAHNNASGTIAERDAFDAVQRQIVQYCADMQRELSACLKLLADLQFTGKYSLNIDEKIEPEFINERRKPNHRIEMDYRTILDLLLGEKIYGDRRIGLRELLQNSIDACKNYLANATPEQTSVYKPIIVISVSKEKNTVTVSDNGIGMTREIVENFFLRIGKSYYGSSKYLSSQNIFENAGYYGIGFFAAFMLSDVVKVMTRRWKSNEKGYYIKLDTQSEYAAIEELLGDELSHGTTTVLQANKFFNKDENDSCFSDIDDIVGYIQNYILPDMGNNKSVEIKVVDDDAKSEVMCRFSTFADKIENVRVTSGEQDVLLDLSRYLNATDCILRIGSYMPICVSRTPESFQRIAWYKYDGIKSIFVPVNYRELKKYAEITYIQIATKNAGYVYLYVDTDENTDPFEYSGFEHERLFSSLKEKIYKDCTLAEFANANNLIINDGYGYRAGVTSHNNVAIVGKFRLVSNGDDVYYIKTNAQFEAYDWGSRELTHGKNLGDKVFIRNILIPQCHIDCSNLLFGKNDVIIPRLNKLLINIRLDGVVPNIDRNNVKPIIREMLSNAISIAIAKAYCDEINVFRDDKFIIHKMSETIERGNIFICDEK